MFDLYMYDLKKQWCSNVQEECVTGWEIPSIRLSGPHWLESFKAGIFVWGEEGGRGQWRSTLEAFLLLLKTEQPSRPFWKTWMSLIQIQLPHSFNTDSWGVHIVFSTAGANRTSDENRFILSFSANSRRSVQHAWRGCHLTMDLPTICQILHLSDSLTLGQRLGEVGPTPGGSGMKGM